MLELTINKWGYLEVDSQEWVEDRTDGIHPEADKAMNHALDNGMDIEDWLDRIDATGLYGEGPARIVNTYNEANFLSGDLGLILAHTERWGDLLIVSNADAYGYGSWIVYRYNGDDDADAYSYGSGCAVCDCQTEYKGGGCDSEWIIESGCTLWQNGGGQTERIGDLIQESEVTDHGYVVCPRCHYGNLTFYGG